MFWCLVFIEMTIRLIFPLFLLFVTENNSNDDLEENLLFDETRKEQQKWFIIHFYTDTVPFGFFGIECLLISYDCRLDSLWCCCLYYHYYNLHKTFLVFRVWKAQLHFISIIYEDGRNGLSRCWIEKGGLKLKLLKTYFKNTPSIGSRETRRDEVPSIKNVCIDQAIWSRIVHFFHLHISKSRSALVGKHYQHYMDQV